MLKKRDRLTARDIESLSLGKSVFGTLVSLRMLPSKKLGFAVSVSKKNLHTAVDRGRMRRRIYSAIERYMPKIKTPALVMIMPKKECLDMPFEGLCREIEDVLAKAGLLG